MAKRQPLTDKIHLETKDGRYSCNQASNTFTQKKTKDHSKVTCMNCLNIIKKEVK